MRVAPYTLRVVPRVYGGAEDHPTTSASEPSGAASGRSAGLVQKMRVLNRRKRKKGKTRKHPSKKGGGGPNAQTPASENNGAAPGGANKPSARTLKRKEWRKKRRARKEGDPPRQDLEPTGAEQAVEQEEKEEENTEVVQPACPAPERPRAVNKVERDLDEVLLTNDPFDILGFEDEDYGPEADSCLTRSSNVVEACQNYIVKESALPSVFKNVVEPGDPFEVDCLTVCFDFLRALFGRGVTTYEKDLVRFDRESLAPRVPRGDDLKTHKAQLVETMHHANTLSYIVRPVVHVKRDGVLINELRDGRFKEIKMTVNDVLVDHFSQTYQLQVCRDANSDYTYDESLLLAPMSFVDRTDMGHAPGTFTHSLIVGVAAEASAFYNPPVPRHVRLRV